jgi:hypothetical protein
MNKFFFVAVISLMVLVQAGFSQPRGTSTTIDLKKHIMVITETRIWFEDTTVTGWPALTASGGQISLYLDETNPVFFALVCNLVKDGMINNRMCILSTEPASGHGGYAKIVTVYLK